MFVKFFSALSKTDPATAGGKGASLGEMTKAKIPVPPGFVILASAFEKFLEETDLDVEINAALKRVKPSDINSVEKASLKIHDLIDDNEMPADIGQQITAAFQKLNVRFVAVRSSATAEDSSVASWAGELETYLNVTQKTLLPAVKKCWASLFTPRAIFYRYEKNLADQKVSVAVIVQKMVAAEVAGICFTAHPVTKDRNQMVIEAGLGLGESVVGGKITPDTYVLKKSDLKTLDVNIGHQKTMIIRGSRGNITKPLSAAAGARQKLSAAQISTLAQLCIRIEKHYGKPQDIEWALEKNRFYIVQSRPITTL